MDFSHQYLIFYVELIFKEAFKLSQVENHEKKVFVMCYSLPKRGQIEPKSHLNEKREVDDKANRH